MITLLIGHKKDLAARLIKFENGDVDSTTSDDDSDVEPDSENESDDNDGFDLFDDEV